MKQEPEKILKRIRKIRKTKRRSIHDCASILSISKEHYLRFESGTAPLTLPDIEVLAQFFGVSLSTVFDDSPLESQSLPSKTRSTRSQYIKLRHKMIQARFNLLREKAGMTLEDIHQSTGIEMEALLAFDNGTAPIPIGYLIKIVDCFEESFDYFYNQNPAFADEYRNHEPEGPKWQPEYPKSEERGNNLDEDPYAQLILALKHISKEDQARIAKILLNNLKS